MSSEDKQNQVQTSKPRTIAGNKVKTQGTQPEERIQYYEKTVDGRKVLAYKTKDNEELIAYPCDMCDDVKPFPNMHELNYHRNVIHNKPALEVDEQHPDNVGNENPEIKCPDCGTVWKNTKEVQDHRQDKHGIQP
jgi:DNA-directed RNA polymerase subunit M/transcription elongation factor TFIIS